MNINGNDITADSVWLCENNIVAIILSTEGTTSRPIRGIVHVSGWGEGEPARCGIYAWEPDGSDPAAKSESDDWSLIRPLMGDEINFLNMKDMLKTSQEPEDE
jgi:hypothetical protein